MPSTPESLPDDLLQLKCMVIDRELDIVQLKAEKRRLELELDSWKSRAETAEREREHARATQ